MACSICRRPTPSRWSSRIRRPEGSSSRACRPRCANRRNPRLSLELGGHLADHLAILFLLLPIALAELGLCSLRVCVADEVLVLRRLALDRRSAPLVMAALACLPGHGCPPRLGKM